MRTEQKSHWSLMWNLFLLFLLVAVGIIIAIALRLFVGSAVYSVVVVGSAIL